MTKNEKNIAVWLFTCAAAVFLMAIIGAITRLTESGLSIVEWKPITGVMMPANAEQWDHAFSLYQESPQYQQVNQGMSLDEFKQIYFWEWLHRLWGRMIGLIFFVPFAWLWWRKKIPDDTKKPLLGILGLGFLQGFMGWFMVKSGLVDQPAVSHYRLAAHLGLAFVIFACLFRMGLHFTVPRGQPSPRLRRLVQMVLGFAGLTIVWGAFVAGLRAGIIYNDNFPLMGDHLWPGEMFHHSPWWINFFENHASVQFTHRVLAVVTFCQVIYTVVQGLKMEVTPTVTRALTALWIVACVQVGLGITTLLTHVDIVVATMHQAGAMLMLMVLMLLLHLIPKKG